MFWLLLAAVVLSWLVGFLHGSEAARANVLLDKLQWRDRLREKMEAMGITTLGTISDPCRWSLGDFFTDLYHFHAHLSAVGERKQQGV